MKNNYQLEVSPTEINLQVLERFHNALKKTINDSKTSLFNFETALSKITKSTEVLALNSGTSALHLSLILAGVNNGDEVICPAFTFAATVNAIMYLGAKPVFIDSENETLNMCPELLEHAIRSRIKEHKKPKAVIVVHAYGMPALLEEIKIICTDYEITLIEDAASSLGSLYKDKHLGTIGDIGVISFNYNKILSTAGGGALLLKTKDEVERALYLSTQAKEPLPYYEHTEVGYNYRMSGLCAELGNQQFEELEARVLKKRTIFDKYFSSLNNIGHVRFINEPAHCFSNRWISTVFFNENSIQKEIKKILHEKLIETRFLWKPMHLQPVFSACSKFLNGNSENFFNTGLCLPSGTNLTDQDQRRVIENMLSYF